jgi:hypothetical protein
MKRTAQLSLAEDMAATAAELRRRALIGIFDGRQTIASQIYIRSCRVVHDLTRTTILFTRDTGHHTSGWWKNPDYERCWHLSLSPAPSLLLIPGRPQVADLDAKVERAWVETFFGFDAPSLWIEPPYSDVGKARHVWHYRLFCNEAWSPIVPRDEVYSKDWTPAGWLSFGDVSAAKGWSEQ